MTTGLLPSSLSAQETPSQTPPPAPGKPGASDPLELLPVIGKIGAEVGLHGGWSKNPYALGSGAQGVGFINLPLKKVGSWPEAALRRPLVKCSANRQKCHRALVGYIFNGTSGGC